MTTPSDNAIIQAFRETAGDGFDSSSVTIDGRKPDGSYHARGRHGGMDIDVNRTADGTIRVRYIDASSEGHAYAEHTPSSTRVQILGGRTETERSIARDAASALAGRLIDLELPPNAAPRQLRRVLLTP
jgi:hypothetical protein